MVKCYSQDTGMFFALFGHFLIILGDIGQHLSWLIAEGYRKLSVESVFLF